MATLQGASVEDRRLVIADINVTEISVTNKSLLSISAVAQCSKLQSANFSFNELTSLQSLAILDSVHSLNVSHNKLKHLAGLPINLRSLKCTHNEISSFETLRSNTSLTELWVANNSIANFGAAVSALKSLTNLKSLLLQKNPCCRMDPPELYRNALIDALPALTMLDATPVTEADHAAAKTFMEANADMWEVHCAMAEHHQARSAATRKSPLRGSASTSSLAFRQTGSLPPAPAPRSTNAYQAPTMNKSASTSTFRAASADRNGTTTMKRSSSLARTGAGILSSSSSSSTAKRQPLSQSASASSLPAASDDAEAPAPKAERPSGMSALMAAVDSLPIYSSFPNSSFPVPLPRSQVVRKAAAAPAAPAAPTAASLATAALVEQYKGAPSYSRNYPNTTNGLMVRCNGSGYAQWPNGSVAVSSDPDPALSAGTWRLFGSFKHGVMAAMVDAAGNGSVNYHTGATCLSFSRATGGFYFDQSGTILLSWDAKGNVTRKHDSFKGDTAAVETRLGPNFGARFVLASKEFELFFACKNVRFKFVHGFNAPVFSVDPNHPLFAPDADGVVPAKVDAAPISTDEKREAIKAAAAMLDGLPMLSSHANEISETLRLATLGNTQRKAKSSKASSPVTSPGPLSPEPLSPKPEDVERKELDLLSP